MNAAIKFKPGVKPPDRSKPRLFAEDYYTAAAKVTYSDYSNAQFPMYGNDKIGDCTFAGLGHLFGAWTKYAQPMEVIFTDQVILRAYSAVSGYDPTTGTNDSGCTLEEVLRFGRVTGLVDRAGMNTISPRAAPLQLHKLDAYAEIRDLSVAGLSRALSVFGGVYVAVDFPQSAQDQFHAGLPWTVNPGSPILGGHCITLQRVHPGMDMLGFTTWGAMQPANRAWVHSYVTEAWAAYSADFINPATGLSPSGLDATRLLTDIVSL